MLSQTVEPLREVSRKSIFDVESFLAIQLDRIVSSGDGVSLAQQGLSRQRAVGDVPPLQRKLDLQRVGCEDHFIGGLRDLELCSRTRLIGVEHPWLVLPHFMGWLWIGDKMYDRGTANGNV